ncbi:MAG: antibiotic ABC transporter ATP-binding protein [Pseudopedobacter saltans]|uniref:Antibiotic ABC transporter ATP-binding protein n=1 Tax=Pseudopedobacter saltans TaxID=151895 RepID=A0A2W5FCQ0_9SPHI|nr:MAG: antibiotic ABC transporter ATP-binding protein [Pseudopedobacter saltans]
MSDNQNKKQLFNYSIFGRLFQYVRPYSKQFYLCVALSIFLAVVTPVRPFLIQLTVDKATGKLVHLPVWLRIFIPNGKLNDTAAFIVSITVFQMVFLLVETTARFIFTYLTSWLGQSVVKDLRISVFQKITHLQLRQFDRTPIGTLTTRTINDIESINDIFTDGFIPIIADLLTIIFTLATMFYVNWQLTLVALIPFPILLIATYYFKEAVNRSFIKVRNAIAVLNAFAQEHISGMFVVQAFGSEKREQKKFDAINKTHRDANIEGIFAYSIFFPIVEIILSISSGLILWYIGGNKLDAGLLVSFGLYINQIFRPLRMIADKFNTLQMGLVSCERVFRIMDIDDVLPEVKNGLHPDKIAGKVTFKNVYFAYIENQYVLKNISFEVKPGQTLALVGHTGSGKTSIISLINRLYPIQKGEILIDDHNIDSYQIPALRGKIGIVLQDVFLFSGSILENITLRNNHISREQAIEAAKMIGVHDFIMRLPNNYDYEVLERGNTLSLGQRQLISFIRALLYDPSILILDEATSSIDSESETLVQHAMEKLMQGRTSIVIAHRLSTIRKADNILVLDKGQIIETGTHDDLLEKGGFYAQLHQMQQEKA